MVAGTEDEAGVVFSVVVADVVADVAAGVAADVVAGVVADADGKDAMLASLNIALSFRLAHA
ncbi:MAG: hypothetical protein ACOYIG_11545 [Acetivibrionales bacterium]